MSILWCAEIGSMHKGEKSLAFELIRQAKEAGATIAKFQFGWTEEAQRTYAGNVNPIRYVDEWADDLKRWCDYFDIELMASIWSMEGLETARRVGMKRYKIAHQMRDWNLIDQIASDAKMTFFSLADLSPAEYVPIFHKVKHAFGSFSEPKGDNYRTIFCTPQYPTYPDKGILPEAFYDTPLSRTEFYGYSDHTHGIEACLLAVARGAQYIEKHFCLDKSDLTVRDTPFSATPNEFAEMVRIGSGMRRLLNASL